MGNVFLAVWAMAGYGSVHWQRYSPCVGGDQTFVPALLFGCSLYAAAMVGIGLGAAIRSVRNSLAKEEAWKQERTQEQTTERREPQAAPMVVVFSQPPMPTQQQQPPPPTAPQVGPLWVNHRLWERLYEQAAPRRQRGFLENVLQEPRAQPEPEDPFAEGGGGFRFEGGRRRRF